jgi:hypothetical protein
VPSRGSACPSSPLATAAVRAGSAGRCTAPVRHDERQCHPVSRAVVQRIGNLDAAFVQPMADVDNGLRARAGGRSVWVAPGTVGPCVAPVEPALVPSAHPLCDGCGQPRQVQEGYDCWRPAAQVIGISVPAEYLEGSPEPPATVCRTRGTPDSGRVADSWGVCTARVSYRLPRLGAVEVETGRKIGRSNAGATTMWITPCACS